jgi:FtsH-binding integral membrane protein
MDRIGFYRRLSLLSGAAATLSRTDLIQEDTMIRERSLRVVLALLGLLFVAGLYPLLKMQSNPGEQMLGAVYVTLGVFLLLTLRNPSAHRSLIAFTAWSSFAHGGIMAVQALRNEIPRVDLVRAVLPLVVIGLVLVVLAPSKVKMVA